MNEHPEMDHEVRVGGSIVRARTAIRYLCASFALLLFAGLGVGCVPGPPARGGGSGASGSTSSGVSGSSGGATSGTAGSLGSAGAIGTAGSLGTAGTPGTAGNDGTGGSSSVGGALGTSGSNGTGGGSGASGADGGVTDSGTIYETDGAVPKNQWVQIFNHKDLSNFHALIHGWKYDDNHYNTFRVDPTTGYLVNSLADYPGGAKGYGGHCGLLYVDKYLTDYRLRIEYHFLPNGDGNNNGGMEVFCQDPAQVTGDPMYAPGLEIQVIAQCTNGCGGGTTKAGDGSNNLSICQPTPVRASNVMGNPTAGTSNCTPGSYAKLPPQAQWVTIECEIHPNSVSKCWNCFETNPTPNAPFPGCTPDVTQRPDITFSGVHDGSGALKGGYFAPVQSEAQEQEYRTIEIMDLSQ